MKLMITSKNTESSKMNSSTSDSKPSLLAIQSLRLFLIILVIAHHAGQPYGPAGGGNWPVEDLTSTPWLGSFFALNASFFMGLFFLLAGLFIEQSYNSKGFWRFVGSRLLRLGLPLVVLVVFAFGAISYAESDTETGFFQYLLTVYIAERKLEFGPLWFIAHLLIYQLLYALYRVLSASKSIRMQTPKVPSFFAVLIFGTLVGLCSTLVRSVYPQDVWITVMGVIPVEPAHLPQYLSLFIVGILASKGQWFFKFSTRAAYIWLSIGMVVFFVAKILPQMFQNFPALLNWSVFWGFTEMFVCIGAIYGLLAFFRENLASPSPWLQQLMKCVYGVYLIHVFHVVPLQLALKGIELPASAKFAIVTLLCVLISFTTIALLRYFRFVRSVLG